MRSGNKFSSLHGYLNHQYLVDHPSIFIMTPDANFEMVIFAGYDIDSSLEHPPMGFANEAYFERFLTDLQRRSFINSGITPEFDDNIVFLVTCIRNYTSPWRRIIVGKLVEIE
jgi:sortase B